MFCSPGDRTGASAVGLCFAHHLTTERKQLRSSDNKTKPTSNL